MCRCGLVGATNVLCGGLVMEAIAYQALVEGSCKPVCAAGPPEPCPYGEPFLLVTSLCWQGQGYSVLITSWIVFAYDPGYHSTE